MDEQPDKASTTLPRRQVLGRVVAAFAITTAVLAVGAVAVYTAIPPAAELGQPVATEPQPGGIADALQRQAAAYAAGDDEGWLAVVNPENAELREQLRRHLDLLRAVGVTAVGSDRPYASIHGTDPVKNVTVTYAICVQVTDCSAFDDQVNIDAVQRYVVDTTWTLRPDGTYVLDGFDIRQTPKTPLWLTEDLHISSTPRVTLFAPAALADRAPQILAQADLAAQAVDRFARWIKPTRYLVYAAGEQEWSRWFDGRQERSNTLAYAIQTSLTTQPVVLNTARVDADELTEVLRHEFGHVVTLLGAVPSTEGPTIFPRATPEVLVSEGIAEYVAYDGMPIGSYSGLASIEALVRKPGWSLDIADTAWLLTDPRRSSSAYGIGFLTVRCVAATSGEDAMFDFIAQVLRDHKPLDVAAPASLGSEWTNVQRNCTRFIRDAIS